MQNFAFGFGVAADLVSQILFFGTTSGGHCKLRKQQRSLSVLYSFSFGANLPELLILGVDSQQYSDTSQATRLRRKWLKRRSAHDDEAWAISVRLDRLTPQNSSQQT